MGKNSILKENLYDFIDERLNESYNNLVRNKNYKELEQSYTQIFNKLKEYIKDKDIIEKYEKSRNDMNDMQEKEAYKTSFNDAITIFLNNAILEDK